MRLLSFLTDIEKALIAESPAVDGGAWETQRMVNFHHGLARVTITPRPSADLPFPGGSVFLQAFVLADGSLCLKTNLSWKDSEAFPAISVYSTPATNWKLEASRIATAWLEGPPALASVTDVDLSRSELSPLAAAVG